VVDTIAFGGHPLHGADFLAHEVGDGAELRPVGGADAERPLLVEERRRERAPGADAVREAGQVRGHDVHHVLARQLPRLVERHDVPLRAQSEILGEPLDVVVHPLLGVEWIVLGDAGDGDLHHAGLQRLDRRWVGRDATTRKADERGQ
jgi:hypothetical protein